MKTIKFFAAALAIVAAASCAEKIDDNTGVEDATPELVEVSFQATIDSPSDPTKTTLAEDGVSVHWTEGDQILVFPYKKGTTSDNDSPYKGKEVSIVNESISEDIAKFSGSAYASNSYAAIYPSSLVYKNGGYANRWGFVANTLRTQTAVAGDFPKVHNVPANISVATDGDGSTMFQFENALAYLKFQVVEDGIYEIELSAAKVSFSSVNDGSDRSLSGEANLGGTLWYRTGTGKFDLKFASDNDQIVITNENKAFVTGTIYYIALPPVDMENLTLTGRNESGIVVFQYTKSSFTAESNTIYNLGSLSASGGSAPTPQDGLTVSANNITIPAAGGSQTFTITTNNDWTITSTQDWVTVSPTSGSAGTHTITLSAEANNTGYNRNRAYIDVKAGSLTVSVTVDQSKAGVNMVFKKGNQVTNPADMKDEGYYLIVQTGSQNYWTINTSGKFVLTYAGEVNKANVFVYYRNDSKETTPCENYAYKSTGTWKALYNNAFLNYDGSINTNESAAQYITLANGYLPPNGDEADRQTEPEIDMYRPKYYDNSDTFRYYEYLTYDNGFLFKYVDQNSTKKWEIYEVSVEYQ